MENIKTKRHNLKVIDSPNQRKYIKVGTYTNADDDVAPTGMSNQDAAGLVDKINIFY